MSVRKMFTFLFVFVFIFSNAAVFAQMPVVAPGMVPPLEGFSKIGVVAAIQGKVEVMTPGAAGRVVQSGEEIFIGDEVKTDALGHLQILLLDETVFTIGPNSAIIIDKFIYDPETHVGNMEASITKGVFRYISGKIAANKPENVTIKLPTATIGIRGTIVAGEASATGSVAMLLGPGSKNETGATIGSFVINGTGGNSGQREHVNRTGFGVSVDQAGSLSGVFQVPEVQIQHLTTALLPAQGQGPGFAAKENDRNTPRAGPVPGTMPGAPATGPGPATTPMTTTHFFGAGENMGKVSGEQTFAGFQTTQQVNMMGMLQTGLNQDSMLASQNARNDSAILDASTQTVRATLKDDLLQHPLGVFHYEHFNGDFIFTSSGTNYSGTFNASIDIDFTSDELGGSHPLANKDSYISISVPDAGGLTDNCVLNAQSFNTLPNADSKAIFQWTNVSGTSAGTFGVTVELQDIVKQPVDTTMPSVVATAAQAKVVVDYSNSTNTGAGEMIAPIQPLPTNTTPE